MPMRVIATPERVAGFDRAMLELGFKHLSPEEIARDRERLGLRSPRKRQGQEMGYYFWRNGLKVKVWTTWLPKERKFRDADQGWVLITKGDRPLHFEHPFNRTKFFLGRLYNWARINKHRLIHRPHCEYCRQDFDLMRGETLKSRGWGCAGINNHPDQEYRAENFEFGLEERELKYVERDRNRGDRYRQIREEEGKPNYTMMLGRKKAIITRPENIVSE
jgi:hypothetical protein